MKGLNNTTVSLIGYNDRLHKNNEGFEYHYRKFDWIQR
jgi:hypothetical protein